MQTSGLPTRVSVPFADSGTKNVIPIPSQVPTNPGAASFTTGFPPATFLPLTAGGIPPDGNDFNGILNAITNNLRWSSAGGTYAYNAAFSAAIGGYPKGAFISTAAYDGYWVSTVENNTTNPDTGGAGWRAVPLVGSNYALDTGTANTYTVVYSPPIVTLTDGLVLLFRAKTANTGSSTFLGVPLLGGALQALQGGEIVANGYIQVIYSALASSFILLSSAGGSPQVPTATKSLHAVNLTQTQSLVASARGMLYVNSNTNISPGTYLVDTSTGGFTLTLPAAPARGDTITYIDALATWASVNFVIARNGKTIMTQSADLTVNVSDQQFSMWYSGSDWRLV